MADTRVWISDLWFKRDKETGKKVHSARHGHGNRWRVQWIDPNTRTAQSKSFAKKPDAEKHRAFTENSLREETYTSSEVKALTVGDAFDAWLTSKKHPKDSSLGSYRERIENYGRPRWANQKLSAVKRTDVDGWISALLDGIAPRREDMQGQPTPLSPATVRGLFVPLNAALNFAEREGWIRRNPARGVEIPRAAKDPIFILSYVELDHLIDTARTTAKPQDGLMIAIMGYMGLRPGEVAALRVSDVNLFTKRLSVRTTMTTNQDKKLVLGETTKTPSGVREVAIPPHLIDDLRTQMGDRAPDTALLTNLVGNEVSLANWRNREWSRALKASSLPEDLTPKGLRHTAASLAIASGADVLVVQRMLGHADATETLNTYGHLFPDRMDEVTSKMSKARASALRAASRKPVQVAA
jgi:integrase